MWIQHEEAPNGASFLSVFLEAEIIVYKLKQFKTQA
jgi:hypothetical protein